MIIFQLGSVPRFSDSFTITPCQRSVSLCQSAKDFQQSFESTQELLESKPLDLVLHASASRTCKSASD